MRVLVTGGSGFVGQNIIQLLLEQPEKFQIFNLSNSPLELKGVTNIKCNAEDFDFSHLKGNYDYIIHLLALSNERYCEDFQKAEAINITFTKDLLEFARKQARLKKFVHMSSTIIYDDSCTPPVSESSPLNFNYTTYSFTKGISEAYANFYREKFDLPVVIFRLSNIYGPYQDFNNSPFLVPSKIVEGLETGKITVFNLKPRRDWIYSGDAAKAVVKSLDSEIIGVYNLAGGRGYSVEEIVSVIAKELEVTYDSLDKPTTGPLDMYCDISKIKKDLDWSPGINLSDGLKITIDYIKGSSH